MTFSFILPVYNTERFLTRCLDSLYAQTSSDFEVIVVDDCSPGDCRGIIQSYGKDIRYIRHEKNKSAFQARLTAIRAAKGDYIVPVDPDDYLMPELLAKAGEIIEKIQPDVISYWIDYDNGKKIYPHWCRHPEAVISGAKAIRELCEKKFATGVATKILRREGLLKAINQLPSADSLYINTSDDFLMLIPLLAMSKQVAFLEYPGYRYFMNEASTSFSWSSAEGLKKAVMQIAEVHACVTKVASELRIDEAVRADIILLLGRMESWFSYNALNGCGADVGGFGQILLDSFGPRNVAEGALLCLSEIRTSRSYKLSKVLATFLKPFKG